MMQSSLFLAHPSITSNEAGRMIMTIPLPPMSPRTRAIVIQNVGQTQFKIPVNVQLPSAILLGNDPSVNFVQLKLRNLGENPLLSPNRPSIYTPFLYLPVSARKDKKKVVRQHKVPVGMNKWADYRRCVKENEKNILNQRLHSTRRGLKRLQTAYFKRDWKSNKRLSFYDDEEKRKSKRRLLELRGFKTPLKVECGLSTCLKRTFRRKQPFRPLSIEDLKSPSILDLSPGRSRSPIIIGQKH